MFFWDRLEGIKLSLKATVFPLTYRATPIYHAWYTAGNGQSKDGNKEQDLNYQALSAW